MKRNLIIILSIVLTPFFGLSQNIFNKHFDTEDGLPSNEVYDIVEDNEGYMWFATDMGVSKYDGYEFTNYSFDSTVLDNAILKLYKAPDGKIWFISLNGYLAYYNYDKIVSFERNEELSSILGDITIYASFNINEKGDIYYGFRHCGLYIIKEGEKIEKPNIVESKRYRRFINEHDNFICYYTNKSFPLNKEDSLLLRFNNERTYIFDLFQVRDTYFNSIKIDDNKWLCSFLNILFELNDGEFKFLKKFPKEIICLFKDNEGNIWIGKNQQGGISFYQSGNYIKEHSFLKNHTVSSITQDFQGGTWCSTTTNGVYYSSDYNNISFNEKYSKENTISDIELIEDDLLILYSNGKVFKVNNDVIELEYEIESQQPLFWLTNMDKKLYAGNSPKRVVFELENNISKKIPIPDITTSIVKKKNDTIWVVKYKGGFYKMQKNDFKTFKNVAPGIRFECDFQDNETYYFGKADGLVKYKNGQYFDISKECAVDGNRIISIAKDSFGNLILGTKNSGIRIVRKKKVTAINIEDGLSSNYIIDIVTEGDTIWCSTRKGINKIYYSNGDLSNLTIDNVTKENGIISNEIKKIIPHKGYIWALTTKGIIKVSRKSFHNKNKPIKLNLSSLLINNNETPIKKHYKLPYNSNNIKFLFRGIDYNSSSNLEYNYFLEGFSDNWSTTSSRKIEFPSLPHGSYTFSLYAKNNTTVSPTLTLQIEISPPWWRTIWAYSLLAIIILLLIVIIFKQRSKKVIQKITLLEKQKRDKLELQLKALRAQMNPHFMFNSLNSILYYILDHNTDAAAKYLTKFSRLIRLILQNSEDGNVSLSKEVETIQLYLELEQLRLENKFDFKILIHSEIQADSILVPTLLIQPIIENAVWHGIMNKEGRGEITIGFEENNNFLVCSIKDDGIGRQEANKAKTEGSKHKSMGLTITKERLRLLHQQTVSNIQIQTTDLIEDDKPAGTLVHIYIPITSTP